MTLVNTFIELGRSNRASLGMHWPISTNCINNIESHAYIQQNKNVCGICFVLQICGNFLGRRFALKYSNIVMQALPRWGKKK